MVWSGPLGAGGHQHMVGGHVSDGLDGGPAPESDVDAGPMNFALEPGAEGSQGGVGRAGQGEGAAEAVRALPQGDPMSGISEAVRCLHTDRSAAHHQYVTLRAGVGGA